jgi:cell division protein FtsQ
VFQARTLKVFGAKHLSKGAVLRVAGVHRGTNLFWFHAGEVERRLEADPWIARALVSRSLPSTLRIAIDERTPVAQVVDGGRFVVVASDGTILTRSRTRRRLPLLIFDMPNLAQQHLRRPAWVVGGMSPWLRSRVTSVLQTSDGSVVVHLASGIPVYYGDATEVTSKDQALAAVLRWAIDGHHPIQAINVRAPLAPTATLQVYVPPVTVPVPAMGRSTTAPSPAATPVATRSARPSAAASPSRAPSSSRSGKPVKGRKPAKGG